MSTYSNSDVLFQGVVQGCLFGQEDRVDALNERIQDRQFSENPLRPNYDPRPIPTKYCRYQIVDLDCSKKTIEPLKNYDYMNNISLAEKKTPFFYAASNNAPFLRNIDLETDLRNQNVVLQHGAPQSIYVPSSNSDLYRIETPTSSLKGEQPFPELFKINRIQTPTIPTISENKNIGNSIMNNHTRTQLRNTIIM
jgi:hypothetical protein